MSNCIVPTTVSPGFLYIKYTHLGQVEHSARWALVNTADVTNVPGLRTEAEEIGQAMKGALADSFAMHTWGILNRDGSPYYEEPFTAPIVGVHSSATGAEDYFSKTITFTGHGLPPIATGCVGKTRSVLFVGKTYFFNIGQKRFPVLTDVGLHAYLTRLNSSVYLPADDYGQQVAFGASAPIQFNAHTQRKEGS